ncbi:MAG: hypothetical protein PHY09_14080 [Desulfuromonadaceae bacterium]|nr:hypothetical protein [Desulfuromonadaceae bacterium]MDD5107748.1 hypothetical protein [Desulfuromonadaceae bacterium]
MSASIPDLEMEKQFILSHIEYLECKIEKFEANHDLLDMNYCKEQIYSLENILAKYRAGVFHLQSEIVEHDN